MFSWVVKVFTQEEVLISIFTSYHDTETRFFGNLTPFAHQVEDQAAPTMCFFFWGPFLCILAVYRMFLPKFTSCNLASLLRGKKSMRRSATVVGSEILAPVDMVDFPFFTGFYTSQGGCLGFLNHSALLGTLGLPNIPAAPDAGGQLLGKKKKCWNPQYCLLQKCCYNWLKKPHEWKWFFALKRMDFSKCHISFLGCDVPKNQWENPRFGEPSSGGAKPLKITLESPPVFQKMGDGLNLPKPVLNTENPPVVYQMFTLDLKVMFYGFDPMVNHNVSPPFGRISAYCF